jgi:predicted RNase H-like HicB family nuclease
MEVSIRPKLIWRILLLHLDPKNKSYASYCPELPGCCSAGDTEEEALENTKEALSLYLEPTTVQTAYGE